MIEAASMVGKRIKQERKEVAFQALLADWKPPSSRSSVHDENLQPGQVVEGTDRCGEAPGPAVPRNQ